MRLTVLGCAFVSLLAACGDDVANPPSPDGGNAITDGSTPLGDGSTALDAAAPVDGAVPVDQLPPTVSGVFVFSLDAGAFPPSPTHPSALVYLPTGFDPTPPLHIVVFLHGFDNCVENVIRDAGSSCDVDAGTPVRQAYALAAQLEASHKNAMLLVPETDYDQATGNPGTLGTQGGFEALLAEVLADMEPQLGHVTVADVGQLIVSSHSGGYQAAAGIAVRGGVPVDELYLFDSLYGNFTDFDDWVMSDLNGLAGSPPPRRFADVYTCCGGTESNSWAMADRAATWVSPDAGILVDDRMTDTWTDPQYLHGLLFKASMLSHDGVPRYYFGRLVSTSTLPDKP